MIRLSISEILEKVSRLKAKEDKIAGLRAQESKPLKDVLKYTFDNRIKFLLPEGPVPYTPLPTHEGQGQLYHESRKLYLFVSFDGVPLHPNLNALKRQTLFIQFLESIDPKDADLIVSIKDKKMPYKGITATLVKEAFPGLINGQVEK